MCAENSQINYLNTDKDISLEIKNGALRNKTVVLNSRKFKKTLSVLGKQQSIISSRCPYDTQLLSGWLLMGRLMDALNRGVGRCCQLYV